jgi:DNA-binding transcriptional regulator YhcF (GntR family)
VQHSTIRVFDAICSLAKKHGKVFPSLQGLAYLAQCHKNTVLAALKQLAFFGFITVYRRLKRVRTPLGFRVEQDTNAYTIQEPNSFGQIAHKLFGFVTESNNWEASPSNFSFDKSKRQNSPSHSPKSDPWQALKEIWEET